MIACGADTVHILARLGSVAERAAELAGVEFQRGLSEAELVALMTDNAPELAAYARVGSRLTRAMGLVATTASYERAAADALTSAGAANAAGALAADAQHSQAIGDALASGVHGLESSVDAASAAVTAKLRSLAALSESHLDGLPLRVAVTIVDHAAESKAVSALLDIDAVQDGIRRWLRERFLPFAHDIEVRTVRICEESADTVRSELKAAAAALETVGSLTFDPHYRPPLVEERSEAHLRSDVAPPQSGETVVPDTPAMPESGVAPPVPVSDRPAEPDPALTPPKWTAPPSPPLQEAAGAVLQRSRDFGSRAR
ncbi:hypothetical protein ONR57_04290 [Hoyosella sp. YIM 151337]|uniref:hypothetical protein n=1 Tax=Hoyosella sp. YIM 151337 TaxID=2992742 RepID=UPI00223651AC|nr:hypothetical protein [Hoyosella sp. YIM 151337]MCW4352520.1 hypothetical protein [Hoyosella sp. YIM 151337]